MKLTRQEHYQRFKELGLAVIENEAQALLNLRDRINENFAQACEILLNCSGRIVVTGMGKSGHIANKIAATLASTGSPAFYVHPGEAGHGDLGMITPKDVVLGLSFSGETQEMIVLLPFLKHMNIPLVAITGNPHSSLACAASVHVDASITKEACPLGLAPTTSTTVMLALGDALAIALLEARGFTAEDFALSHPNGSLGKRLLLKVHDIMRTGAQIPQVLASASLSEALIEMTHKHLGMTLICDPNQSIQGIFTDGDLRRALDANLDIRCITIEAVMNKNYKTISANLLAVEAMQIMKQFQITSLVVENEQHQAIGIVHMHDLLQAGVV